MALRTEPSELDWLQVYGVAHWWKIVLRTGASLRLRLIPISWWKDGNILWWCSCRRKNLCGLLEIRKLFIRIPLLSRTAIIIYVTLLCNMYGYIYCQYSLAVLNSNHKVIHHSSFNRGSQSSSVLIIFFVLKMKSVFISAAYIQEHIRLDYHGCKWSDCSHGSSLIRVHFADNIVVFFIFIQILVEHVVSKQWKFWSDAAGLGLHCLPMPNKKDARLIWVNLLISKSTWNMYPFLLSWLINFIKFLGLLTFNWRVLFIVHAESTKNLLYIIS